MCTHICCTQAIHSPGGLTNSLVTPLHRQCSGMMSDGLPHEEAELLAALQQSIGLTGARALQVGILD